MRRQLLVLHAVSACLVLLSACRAEPPKTRSTQFTDLRGDSFQTTADIRLAGRIDGFYGPESVRYDPAQDIYFVSNMMGPGSSRDGTAFISRIGAADLEPIDVFIESGRNGVTLNAPKGMVLQGDTLWVADIDVIRGFERRTGKPLRTIDLTSLAPQLLNDIAVSPDGVMYVSDTGIEMTDKGVLHPGGDRVIAIPRVGAPVVRTDKSQMTWPNGIAWDGRAQRWIVVSFDPFVSAVVALSARGGAPDTLMRGKGRYDGVEVLEDGAILVSCWNDQSLHMITPDGRDIRLIGNLFTPADIGIDTRRNRVAIPLASRGRVEVWDLPGSSQLAHR
jgi:hypothetical protein